MATFFDMLNEITNFKGDLDFTDPDVLKNYDEYMINRYLSSLDVLVPFVNDVNLYPVPKATHYALFRDMIPKGNYSFDYVRKSKKDDQKEEMLQCLCKYYEIGLREAEMYFQILTGDQLRTIATELSYGKDGKNLAIQLD